MMQNVESPGACTHEPPCSAIYHELLTPTNNTCKMNEIGKISWVKPRFQDAVYCMWPSHWLCKIAYLPATNLCNEWHQMNEDLRSMLKKELRWYIWRIGLFELLGYGTDCMLWIKLAPFLSGVPSVVIGGMLVGQSTRACKNIASSYGNGLLSHLPSADVRRTSKSAVDIHWAQVCTLKASLLHVTRQYILGDFQLYLAGL